MVNPAFWRYAIVLIGKFVSLQKFTVGNGLEDVTLFEDHFLRNGSPPWHGAIFNKDGIRCGILFGIKGEEFQPENNHYLLAISASRLNFKSNHVDGRRYVGYGEWDGRTLNIMLVVLNDKYAERIVVGNIRDKYWEKACPEGKAHLPYIKSK
jgi:hypothetical protein